MHSNLLWVVCLTIVVALIFDVVNGFHDAANSIATIVSTRVLSPRTAVIWAAGCNFLAMFIFEPRVANTISKMIRVGPDEPAFVLVVLAAVLGALLWDVATWWWGLPTSSSHALVGALGGAGLAWGGIDALNVQAFISAFEFVPLAPLLGFILGSMLLVGLAWALRRVRPLMIDAIFRRLQLVSAALYALGHGGNDAQKTIGIIVALLIASGEMPVDYEPGHIPWAVIFACNAAMALGTSLGGWRIVKTMGMRITRLTPVSGFCAELGGATALFGITYAGIPVSTTHVITGSILGVGSTRSRSGVRWGTARRIVWAWVLTAPAAGLAAALCLIALRALSHAFAGPL